MLLTGLKLGPWTCPRVSRLSSLLSPFLLTLKLLSPSLYVLETRATSMLLMTLHMTKMPYMVETLTILLLRIPQTHLSPSLSSNASAATKHGKLAASTAKLDERRRYKQRRRTDVKPEK